MNTIPKPELPAAQNLGNWVRLRAVRREHEDSQFRISYPVSHWVVEFENAVGGQVGYRFKRKSDARVFLADILGIKPEIRYC